MRKFIKIFIVMTMLFCFASIRVEDAQAMGRQQDKIVAIAVKEKGSRYKRKYGARPWCAAFISWAARRANVSTSVIPKTASSTTMYKQVLKKGGKRVKIPQKGDLVFYKRSSRSSSMMHVALMTSSTMSIHGNYSRKVSYIKATDYRTGRGSGRISKKRIVYVRPCYPKAPSRPTLTSASFIDEKVQIKWKKVSHTSSYTIYMKDDKKKTVFSKNVSSKLSSYTFTYNNQKYGKYALYIKANNSIGSSSLSSAKYINYVAPVTDEELSSIQNEG
jgi:hypothetical protein